MHDVIIIGAGAAGLSAAIFSAKRGLKTLVVSVNIGGQTNLASNIQNYPSSPPTRGPPVIRKFEEQARKFGAEFVPGRVVGIEKKTDFAVKLEDGKGLEAKAVILAIGSLLPDNKFIGNFVEVNEKNEVIIDSACHTSVKGVFAAGDVTTMPYKQLVISAGEGAKAALEACKYIKKSDGVIVDWA
jgi:thioredoxin reductase